MQVRIHSNWKSHKKLCHKTTFEFHNGYQWEKQKSTENVLIKKKNYHYIYSVLLEDLRGNISEGC